MRQIMPIAAGLAGGVALGSFGAISSTMRWGSQWTRSRAAIAVGLMSTVAASGAATSAASASPMPSWRDEA